MSEFWIIVIVLAVMFASPLAFIALDNWHKRYAWRNAHREAERYMRMRRGEPPQ